MNVPLITIGFPATPRPMAFEAEVTTGEAMGAAAGRLLFPEAILRMPLCWSWASCACVRTSGWPGWPEGAVRTGRTTVNKTVMKVKSDQIWY